MPTALNTPRGPAHGPWATVVAFDGVVADTRIVRVGALREALVALGAPTDLAGRAAAAAADEALERALAGRTFAEAARLLVSSPEHGADGDAARETTVDLVALDAARRFSTALSNGVSLVPGAAEVLGERARSGKLVARADSARRDVETVLAFAGLENAFTFVRCSDDMPRPIGISSLEGSWLAIDRRLGASGVPRERRVALEFPDVAAAARPFVAEVQAPRFGERA